MKAARGAEGRQPYGLRKVGRRGAPRANLDARFEEAGSRSQSQPPRRQGSLFDLE
jgi:hypothetical protein